MTVYSLDREAVEADLARWVDGLAARPEVEAVVLFGSFATGRALPGSDLDLLIVLREDVRPFLDRLPDYMPDEFPVPVDVFPYTVAEIAAGQPLASEALRRGKFLWAREGSRYGSRSWCPQDGSRPPVP